MNSPRPKHFSRALRCFWLCVSAFGVILPSITAGRSTEHYGNAFNPSRLGDSGNQLQSQMALGLRRVVGTVDQPAHVTINGQPIPVDDELRFEGFVNTLETREVLIEAVDASDNTTTTGYWFAEPDNTQGAVLRHDLNGNLVEVESHTETRTYEWDALNRLIQAEVMSRDGSEGLRKNYYYDPVCRLTRTETQTWDGSAWLPDDSFYYVYAGLERIEKRAADGTTVLREYFGDGFTEGSNAYLYGRDHLGSIVELIDASTGAVVSTRAFSPYGRILTETGSVQADFAFTGHFHDADFDLHHAPARVYDASLGRWLTPDPLPDAESLPEGTNLYAYVGDDPVNFTDPFGFCRQSANTAQGSKASPPRQSGGSGTGNGGPPKRTASSASPSGGGNGKGDLAKAGNDLYVGTYNQVRRANIIAGKNATHTPHHVLQNALSPTSLGRGVTINLSKKLHSLTRTFRKPLEQGLNLRTHLARDLRDLRTILGNAGYNRSVINRQLQELVRQNKALGRLSKP